MTLLETIAINLSADDVLRGQGADPVLMRQRRPALVATAEWALAEGLPLLQPKVAVRQYEVVGTRHEQLLLKAGKSLRGKLIVQHLSGAAHVAVMACTIGPALEEVSGEMMASDPLLALAMEGVGTAAVEQLATQACAQLEADARQRGWQASIPLSPGMVGWEVDPGQRQLFDLVDAGEAGIYLNGSLVMVPRMSISQVQGYGPEMALQGKTCDFCSLRESCRYQDHYLERETGGN